MLNIYTPSYGSCSNNGITANFDHILIPCKDGPYEVNENHPPKNLMKLIKDTRFGATTLHLEPWEQKEENCAGPMFGGCFASTSDSRWIHLLEDTIGHENARLARAIPVHDRYETWKEYNSLSI